MEIEDLKLLTAPLKTVPNPDDNIELNELVLSTLNQFDWFSGKESDFVNLYKNNLIKTNNAFNCKVLETKQKLFNLLEKTTNEKKLSENVKKLSISVANYIFESKNLC
jgi:hypothetical protein